MSQMGSDSAEDAVAGHARLLVTTAATAMSAGARALAQRNRAAREREQAALAELRARAETDRRLMLLRLEMSRTASWRAESTLIESAQTLHLARLYASVEPTAAAAVPTLEEHIRTRWQREPDEVLAEQAHRAQQAREEAREAEAVWAAARTGSPDLSGVAPSTNAVVDQVPVERSAEEISSARPADPAQPQELLARESGRADAGPSEANTPQEQPGDLRAAASAAQQENSSSPTGTEAGTDRGTDTGMNAGMNAGMDVGVEGRGVERAGRPESMHAHPAGAATEKTATKDQSAGELAEQLLQQRRRAAQRGAEREGHDRGGYDR